MTYLITFLDNNGKLAVYSWRNIHVIYHYLEIIGSPTTLTTSGQRYNHFGPSSSTNNDISTTQPVIAALRSIQNLICKCCRRIGHKPYAYIICGHKSIPSSLRRNTNKLNALHGDEPTDAPREWNIQPTEAHFKYRTSPPKTSPVVSDITGRLYHHAIDNGDVEVYPS